MLRYCAWCGKYQGSAPGHGHQIRKNICEIDTSTICSACLNQLLGRGTDSLPIIEKADPFA